MSVKNRPPFRYDIVGSFLRPAALKEKREAFAAGKISAADLKEAEDAAIQDLVAKEKEVGLHAVTDGEFRRRYWHLDFLTELEGVTEISAENWSVHFKGAQPKARTAKITGPISFGNHPFLDHFRFLKETAGDTLAKMTIPSPSMLHLICCVREKHYEPIPQYQDQNRLFTDIALPTSRPSAPSTPPAAGICSWMTPAGENSATPTNGRLMQNGVSTWMNWPAIMWI